MVNTLNGYHFNLLKSLTLSVSGFVSANPSNCRAMSFQVMHKTNLSVSETTIKRFYGFAIYKFTPSLFTLDALAQYCDFKGWKDFCIKNLEEPDRDDDQPPYWQVL